MDDRKLRILMIEDDAIEADLIRDQIAHSPLRGAEIERMKLLCFEKGYASISDVVEVSLKRGLPKIEKRKP